LSEGIFGVVNAQADPVTEPLGVADGLRRGAVTAESRLAVHGDIVTPTDELDRLIAKCKKSGSFF